MRARWLATGLIVGVGWWLVSGAVPAGAGGAAGEVEAAGGGGCHRVPSERSGTSVEYKELCASPTILQMAGPGSVTFTNSDEMPHNVAGGAFYADLPTVGSTATFAFDEPGIYPYACTLHPGMNGAVVVGAAEAATAGRGEVRSVQAAYADASAASTTGTGTGTDDGTGGEVPLSAAGGAALAGVGLGIVGGHRLARGRRLPE